MSDKKDFWEAVGATAAVLAGFTGAGWSLSGTSGTEDSFGEVLSSPSDFTESMGGIGPAIGSTTLGATGTWIYCTSSEDDGIVVWKDSGGGWHIGNTVPYSRVEKRAQQTYDLLHGKGKTEWRVPAVAAESREGLEAFTALFGDKPSGDRLTETLSVLECVLERGDDERPA